MNWAFLFGFVNALALVGWLALAAMPRGPKSSSLIMYGCVAMLCLIYAVLFVLLFVPETKSRTLEELEHQLMSPAKATAG